MKIWVFEVNWYDGGWEHIRGKEYFKTKEGAIKFAVNWLKSNQKDLGFNLEDDYKDYCLCRESFEPVYETLDDYLANTFMNDEAFKLYSVEVNDD